ncbi:hypothetical protein [Mangrovibacter phragmitis]|uniref:hypothetical protein n=1 Tax=Mangrovibacter phragmitis TaxID=1691903 RepID=UPI0031FFC171
MIIKWVIGAMMVLTSEIANAGCWVVTNLHGYGFYEYNTYDFTKDGFSGKEFVVNFDKKSPSVTDSLMTYTVLSPTSMVGTYVTNLGLTIQTWQLSTDGTKAFMTINRTNSDKILQDGVSAFVGDIKATCEH